MKSKYVAPGFEMDAFNCPHCEAYAKQRWFDVAAGKDLGMHSQYSGFFHDLKASFCDRCNNYALWINEKMIYPFSSIAPLPTDDMPEDVKKTI